MKGRRTAAEEVVINAQPNGVGAGGIYARANRLRLSQVIKRARIWIY